MFRMPATRSIELLPTSVPAYGPVDTAPPRTLAHRRIDQLLGCARTSQGGAVVLRAPSGTASALPVDYAAERAGGMRVVRVAGVQSESALDFAALQQIVHPFIPHLGRVPGPQRAALRAVLGFITAVPNLFLAGMAVLALLADAAAERPLLLIVEDAQWLDPATSAIVAFIARRLTDHPLAMVITVHEQGATARTFPDLPDVSPSPRERSTRAEAGEPDRTPARARHHARAATRTTPLLVPLQLGDAPSTLLSAAEELHDREPERARGTLLDAMYASLMAGHLTRDATLSGITAAAQAWQPGGAERPTAADLLLEGFTARLTIGYPAAAPILRRAVTHLLRADEVNSAARSLLAMGCWAAGDLMDAAAQRTLAQRWERARHTGNANDRLPIAISLPGPFAAGPAPSCEPGHLHADLTGLQGLLALAWTGDEAATRSAATAQARAWTERGLGVGVQMARYAETILDLGLGRYDTALTSALDVYRADPPDLGTHVLPDLVEAASRTGHRDAAEAAVERLRERAAASGSATGAGLLARAAAMIAEGADAEAGYRTSVERLTAARSPTDLARTHLLYGEWLRRHRRRRDAREQLGHAGDMFTAMGATAFARRAASELDATAERVGPRTDAPQGHLTPQEAKVARLVAEGSTNRQVAEQLFISTNTVEYHLQKVFRKLGVSSRTQLVRALLTDPQLEDAR
jgi:DNA-binding CsgD family transcriptional regulator